MGDSCKKTPTLHSIIEGQISVSFDINVQSEDLKMDLALLSTGKLTNSIKASKAALTRAINDQKGQTNFIKELLQNAEDSAEKVGGFYVNKNDRYKCITISYSGKRFTKEDIDKFESGESSKDKLKYRGEKGMGLKSLFSKFKEVIIKSGDEYFICGKDPFVKIIGGFYQNNNLEFDKYPCQQRFLKIEPINNLQRELELEDTSIHFVLFPFDYSDVVKDIEEYFKNTNDSFLFYRNINRIKSFCSDELVFSRVQDERVLPYEKDISEYPEFHILQDLHKNNPEPEQKYNKYMVSEDYFIRFCFKDITKYKEGGGKYDNNLFVLNRSKVTIPSFKFYFDGPFQLTTDRDKLNADLFDYTKSIPNLINIITLKLLIDGLISFVKEGKIGFEKLPTKKITAISPEADKVVNDYYIEQLRKVEWKQFNNKTIHEMLVALDLFGFFEDDVLIDSSRLKVVKGEFGRFLNKVNTEFKLKIPVLDDSNLFDYVSSERCHQLIDIEKISSYFGLNEKLNTDKIIEMENLKMTLQSILFNQKSVKGKYFFPSIEIHDQPVAQVGSFIFSSMPDKCSSIAEQCYHDYSIIWDELTESDRMTLRVLELLSETKLTDNFDVSIHLKTFSGKISKLQWGDVETINEIEIVDVTGEPIEYGSYESLKEEIVDFCHPEIKKYQDQIQERHLKDFVNERLKSNFELKVKFSELDTDARAFVYGYIKKLGGYSKVYNKDDFQLDILNYYGVSLDTLIVFESEKRLEFDKNDLKTLKSFVNLNSCIKILSEEDPFHEFIKNLDIHHHYLSSLSSFFKRVVGFIETFGRPHFCILNRFESLSYNWFSSYNIIPSGKLGPTKISEFQWCHGESEGKIIGTNDFSETYRDDLIAFLEKIGLSSKEVNREEHPILKALKRASITSLIQAVNEIEEIELFLKSDEFNTKVLEKLPEKKIFFIDSKIEESFLGIKIKKSRQVIKFSPDDSVEIKTLVQQLSQRSEYISVVNLELVKEVFRVSSQVKSPLIKQLEELKNNYSQGGKVVYFSFQPSFHRPDLTEEVMTSLLDFDCYYCSDKDNLNVYDSYDRDGNEIEFPRNKYDQYETLLKKFVFGTNELEDNNFKYWFLKRKFKGRDYKLYSPNEENYYLLPRNIVHLLEKNPPEEVNFDSLENIFQSQTNINYSFLKEYRLEEKFKGRLEDKRFYKVEKAGVESEHFIVNSDHKNFLLDKLNNTDNIVELYIASGWVNPVSEIHLREIFQQVDELFVKNEKLDVKLFYELNSIHGDYTSDLESLNLINKRVTIYPFPQMHPKFLYLKYEENGEFKEELYIGSFNWLSNSGRFSHELTTKIIDSEIIEEFKNKILGYFLKSQAS